MKLLKIAWLLAMASSAIFPSCKKDKTQEEEQLPAITQTGANTFGCLINGKVYTPKGFEQNKPNFNMIVDLGNNGNLDIRTFRKDLGLDTRLTFSAFGISSTGTYTTGTSMIFPSYVRDLNSGSCYFTSSNNNYKSGVIIITKYDNINKIFSGQFEFDLYDPSIGCDTIKIRQGRFDKKL
jgi:hypothetical protein